MPRGPTNGFDPRLTISNEALQYLDDGDFRYLVRPTNVHSGSLTPYETFSKKTAVAYGADLLAFELNGEVVSGLPGHHSSENLVLSWARRVVGDACLEIHVLAYIFLDNT